MEKKENEYTCAFRPIVPDNTTSQVVSERQIRNLFPFGGAGSKLAGVNFFLAST
jgi:hypothetical protein